MSPVYASAGGTRYHAAANCQALTGGQLMNDYYRVFWLDGNRHKRVRPAQETTPQQAAADGKQPCARCRPPLPDPAPYEDFEHEPMDVYTNGKLRAVWCYRCRIPWPCTTAVVLGLVERKGRP